MIDTITLRLTKGMYVLFARAKFVLSTSRKGISKLVLNPTKAERVQGIYYPYLTLNNRVNKFGWSEESLTIQVSLPKLMFGNNFDELSDNDWTEVLKRIKDSLRRMDVGVFESQLVNAQVIGVHYGKNVVLRDGTTPKMIIDKIAQGDYSRRVDVETTKYRNNGLGWKLHTNRWELAFYDKKADLQQAKISDRRSEVKDDYVQLNLFDEPKRYKPFEVLRMEVRLNNRTMIRYVFEKTGIIVPTTFEYMFSEQIMKYILLYYVDMTETARPAYIDYHSTGSSDLLAEIKINNPKLSPINLLAIAYLKQAFDQNDTLGSIRQIIAPQSDPLWRRLIKKVKSIRVARRDRPLTLLRSQIEQYKPLQLVDFQDQMINND